MKEPKMTATTLLTINGEIVKTLFDFEIFFEHDYRKNEAYPSYISAEFIDNYGNYRNYKSNDNCSSFVEFDGYTVEFAFVSMESTSVTHYCTHHNVYVNGKKVFTT